MFHLEQRAERPPARGWRVIIDKLTRYCLREIAVPAVLAMAIIGFVGVANELRERRGALKDTLEFISGWDMARLIAFYSPTLVAYLIPIAFMMGILLAFGRLAQHNEITAMKAAGIPLKRLVVPVVFVGALLSIGTFYLQDRVQPRAIKQANQLLYAELPQRVTLDVLPVGVMNEFGGIFVYFKSRDKENKLLRDVVVISRQQSSGTKFYYAETAQFEELADGPKLVMRNCQVVTPRQGDDAMGMSTRETSVALSSPALRPPPGQHRELTMAELFEREKHSEQKYAGSNRKANEEELRTVRTEIADRITLPFACLAVSLAAAPLAVRAPRTGRSFSFAIGITLLGGYYLMRILLEAKSVHPLEDYVLRGFAPNVVLAVIGLWALWRVDRV